MFGTITLALISVFFFFNDTATTEIYTLSLHDALPIYLMSVDLDDLSAQEFCREVCCLIKHGWDFDTAWRSEEHTSELQSQSNLVCRLLLEKKKKIRSLPLLLPPTLRTC